MTEQNSEKESQDQEIASGARDVPPSGKFRNTKYDVPVFICLMAIAIVVWYYFSGRWDGPPVAPKNQSPEPRSFVLVNQQNPDHGMVHYWDGVPLDVAKARMDPGKLSNIRPGDYVGSEACITCHAKIHEQWSAGFHNLAGHAPDQNVIQGDFSGEASVDYLGGAGTFYQENDEYRMRLVRGEISRTYKVTGTIGGRFFQAYSGRLIEGPEEEDNVNAAVGGRVNPRVKEIYLPFQYWIDRGEWVPFIQAGDGDVVDDERPDPFAEAGFLVNFDSGCAACHTTRPLGDWLVSRGGMSRVAFHARRVMGFALAPYLARNHPNIVDPKVRFTEVSDERINFILDHMDDLPVETHSITRGVACEACHNGCRQHVQNSTPEKSGQSSSYFAAGEYVILRDMTPEDAWGANAVNLNFTCARCHTAERPRYENGMSTFHGASMSDADRGPCFHAEKSGEKALKKLTCVHCHDPHDSAGATWNDTPVEEDTRCTTCHDKYQNAEKLKAHTRHEADSAGSRCMNCHMPKMIQGRQDVVRSHMIFSPTDVKMLEANQPNACNLCHLDQPIDWTLKYLQEWYVNTKAAADETKAGEGGKSTLCAEPTITASYPQRDGPVGLGWLRSYHGPTRLVAIEALSKSNARWALADLITALDDAYLANRMFAQKNLEEMLNVSLKDYGYRFSMTPSERREPLARIRAGLLEEKDKDASPSETQGGDS